MTLSQCLHHADNAESKCEGCGLDIDYYGNTENDFRHCSFPDCGCDGARLCMAKLGPSENSREMNVEGMYSMKTAEQRLAVQTLITAVALVGAYKP